MALPHTPFPDPCPRADASEFANAGLLHRFAELHAEDIRVSRSRWERNDLTATGFLRTVLYGSTLRARVQVLRGGPNCPNKAPC
ncbi:hypothetical protein HEP84_01830 [Streptomyces sp. RLB1-33]|nr:hypothetical protein [Streptomyces sp. RLB1-33]QIY68217.1 hypothetical protein HEP84_01830 [Streptomyces sp. RLB1-33]